MNDSLSHSARRVAERGGRVARAPHAKHPLKTSGYGGHSANVRIRLVLNGDSLEVTQVRPDLLLPDAPADHLPGPAHPALQMHQSERSWDVSLPDGISGSSERVVSTAKPQSRPRQVARSASILLQRRYLLARKFYQAQV